MDSIFCQLELLQEHLQLGRVMPELDNELMRELLFRQYRLLYRIVTADRIDALAVQTGLRSLQLPV